MSIADKLTQAAENVPKVYAAGQASMVDESKLIPKTVSGSYISVDDVSEVPHNVTCKVSGVDDLTSVKVTRCGRNFWNLTVDDYLNSTDIAGNGTRVYLKLKPNTQYTMSSNHVQVGTESDIWFNGTSSGVDTVNAEKPCTKTTDENGCLFIALRSSLFEEMFANDWFQIVEGTVALPYEAYNGQTLTPNADGTIEGMTSVSPYMNIFSDNEGVNIEATYNKSWGMQTEYDRFWDSFQKNGERTQYHYSFLAQGWTEQNLRPKYNMQPTMAHYMFYCCGEARERIDLVACLKVSGATLDFSKCTTFNYCFMGSNITHIGTIDFRSCEETTTSVFRNCYYLETIEKCIVAEHTKIEQWWFANNTALKNIIFEGVIGLSIYFQHSPLTKESITSIVEHLSDTATGQTLTLKRSAVNTAFETSEGAADGSTSEEFVALVATKTNWTITMV